MLARSGDQGLRSLKRSVFTLPGDNRTMSSAAVSSMATPRTPEFNLHSPAGDIKLRKQRPRNREFAKHDRRYNV
jgi:hypothetical protein